MFKESKKHIDLLTFALLLIIVNLIPKSVLNFECKSRSDFEQSERQKIDYFWGLETSIEDYRLKSQYTDYIMGKGSFGTVMILPNDNTKVVKLQNIKTEEELVLLNEIDIALKFSERDLELEGQFRVAPRIDTALCVNVTSKKKFVPISGERFRGDLEKAIKDDTRFISTMTKTSNRFEFYKKMMQAFSQIAHLKYKHCDLKPANLLYKEENADFEIDYLNEEEELTYFPVVTDFGFTVP